MSSPSKPLSIGSPRPGQPIDDGDDENIVHTPDLRLLRQQFGTPPVGTTIPPFRTPGSLSHAAIGSPLRPSSSAEVRPQGTSTPLETADVPGLGDDERIKILRKHLVSREERMGHSKNPSKNTSRLSSRRPSVHENQQTPSRHESRPSTPGPSQSNSSPFPIPYHAPGADITYVCVIRRRILFVYRALLFAIGMTFTNIKNVHNIRQDRVPHLSLSRNIQSTKILHSTTSMSQEDLGETTCYSRPICKDWKNLRSLPRL
jgi:hypothetical protein